MIQNHKRRFVRLSLLVSVCAAGWFATACSDDDDKDKGDGDGGSSSGGRATGGGTGAGGSNAGGSNAGGSNAGGSNAGGSEADAGTGGYGGDAGPDGAPDAAPPTVMFRLVHAAPGTPDVDIYVAGNDTPIAEDVSYGEATPYLPLAEGSYELEMRAAASAPSTQPLFTTPAISVTQGERYTAIAAGDLTSTDAADRFRVLSYRENFGDTPAGTARARIVHANYDGTPVDLDLGNDDPAAPEITALAPFGATDEAGVELLAGATAQVGVVVTGVNLTAFTLPALADAAGAFIIATGLAGSLAREPLGLAALAVLPDSSTVWIRQNPRIYALHASPDAGFVDVYIGDKEVIDYAAFGDMKLVQVPPGTATLDFFAGAVGPTARPSTAPVASATTPSLEAGVSHLGVVAGTLAPATFQLITVAEGFELGASPQARLRAVHASAMAPEVDVGTVTTPGTLDSPPVFAALSFSESSAPAGVLVPAASLTLGAGAAGTTVTGVEFAVTTLAGQRAFAVLAGEYLGVENPLQLFVVDTAGAFWSAHAVLRN